MVGYVMGVGLRELSPTYAYEAQQNNQVVGIGPSSRI